VAPTPDEPTPLRLRVSPREILIVLAAGAAILAAAGIASAVMRVGLGHGQLHGLVPLFDLDREGNLPAAYGASLLALCATTLWLIAAHRRQTGATSAGALRFLSLLVLVMAVDEATQIHELLVEPLRSALGLGGILYYSWVVLYGAVLLGLALAFLPRLLRLPPPVRRRVILAIAIYVGGALGMELPSGWVAESQGQEGSLFATLTTFEESLELAGVLLLLHTLLTCLGAACGSIEARFTRSTGPMRR
jgi:hypothetical protein